MNMTFPHIETLFLRTMVMILLSKLVVWSYKTNTMTRLTIKSKLNPNNNIFKHARIFSSTTYDDKSLTSKDSTNEKFELISEIPIKISYFVHSDIVYYLNMRNPERKGKLLLPKKLRADQLKLSHFRELIERQLPSLSEKPYVLRYLIQNEMFRTKTILSDVQLKELLSRASTESCILQLFIETNPPINFPPPYDSFPESMPDPLETETFSMVSFYKFNEFSNPEEIAKQLDFVWKYFGALGRVYVAKEGINAQMAIPTNVLEHFRNVTMHQFPFFGDLYLNIDHLLSVAVFDENPPFKNLHIRVRDQIVADGFDSDMKDGNLSLDWNKSGREMPPLEWHEKLDDAKSIILDCRNSYETDVGTFKNAIPLGTTFFRESWDALEEKLKDVPKDSQLLTFCTGGIRCVKINAYLEQKLGFTNVNRLQGGIISYVREIENAKNLPTHHLERDVQESKFKGTNYVFDERLGARITADVFTLCETCGEKCDFFTNCNYTSCHVRFIQCLACRNKYTGCCSAYCQDKHQNEVLIEENAKKQLLLSRRKKQLSHSRGTTVKASVSRVIDLDNIENSRDNIDHAKSKQILSHSYSSDHFMDALNVYCEKYSTQESILLQQLREETCEVYPESTSRMLSGPLQGKLLSLLASLSKCENALELGAFTGYATLSIAEGIASVIDDPKKMKIFTCEPDPKSSEIAQKYFSKSPFHSNIELSRIKASELIELMREKSQTFQLAFIDADKKQYENYLMDIIGYTFNSETQQYTKSKPSLLDKNALVVVDNTLWKGLVLGQDEDLRNESPDAASFGDVKRMQTMASWMHQFNTMILRYSNIFEVVLLPLRDGLSIIRYKGDA